MKAINTFIGVVLTLVGALVMFVMVVNFDGSKLLTNPVTVFAPFFIPAFLMAMGIRRLVYRDEKS